MAEKNSRNPTRVEQPLGRRETKYQAGPVNPASAVRPDPVAVKPKFRDNRKIIGVLVSYTWEAEGQVFPVRQGRTHIGAGQIKEDTEHRVVDVYCPDDNLLSEDHAVILIQKDKFWIRDLDSTNGTFLNGEQLRPDQAEELPNNSEIKTGKTVFTFLKIEPKSAAVTEPRREPARQDKEHGPVRDPTILK